MDYTSFTQAELRIRELGRAVERLEHDQHRLRSEIESRRHMNEMTFHVAIWMAGMVWIAYLLLRTH